MAKYTAKELGRIYAVEKKPDPWGWIMTIIVVLIAAKACGG